MNLEAVFIHLGKSPAEHLWLNLSRHQALFPNIRTAVIIDFEGHLKNVPAGVETYLFKRNDLFLSEDRFNSHDQKFRRGFWRYSLERLFAFAEYHDQRKSDCSLLHIESDVLLLPDFPWDFLEKQRSLFWNIYNGDRDVSALLLSPNKMSTHQLLENIKFELIQNPAHTDMTVLSKVRKNNPEFIRNFPALSKVVPELINSKSKDSSSIEIAHSDLPWPENGIFDGAPIGMWLCGHDPRNNYGHAIIHDSSPIINGDSIVDPSNMYFEMKNDGSLGLSSGTSNVSIPLWNLHVHSKSLKLFSENWKQELRYYVELSSNKEEVPFYRISALKSMFLESIKGRTFLRFIIGLPHVHALRRRLSPIKRHILARYPILNSLARKL